MQLKATKSADVSYTSHGMIAIEQWDETYNEPVFVYLTVEQFRSIQRWVDHYESDITSVWNSGVDDGES